MNVSDFSSLIQELSGGYETAQQHQEGTQEQEALLQLSEKLQNGVVLLEAMAKYRKSLFTVKGQHILCNVCAREAETGQISVTAVYTRGRSSNNLQLVRHMQQHGMCTEQSYQAFGQAKQYKQTQLQSSKKPNAIILNEVQLAWLARWTIYQHIAFNAYESETIQRIFQVSRKEMADQVLKLAVQITNTLDAQFRSHSGKQKAMLLYDGWQSAANSIDRVYVFLIKLGNQQIIYVDCLFIEKEDAATGLLLALKVQAIIVALEAKQIQVIGQITDNGANCVAVGEIIRAPETYYLKYANSGQTRQISSITKRAEFLSIRCTMHSISLALKDAIKDNIAIERIIELAREKNISISTTRVGYLAQTVIRLEHQGCPVGQLYPDEAEALKTIQRLLLCVQADAYTAIDFMKAYNLCVEDLMKQRSTFATDLIMHLQERLQRNMQQLAHVHDALFILTSDEFVLASQMMLLFTQEASDALNVELPLQLIETIKKKKGSFKAYQERHRFSFYDGIIGYYNTQCVTEFVELAACCPVSTASVERLFSFCNLLIKNRLKLGREQFQSALIVRFNSNFVENNVHDLIIE